MSFLKTGAARWVVPAALAAVLAAALLVTPVIGASSGVTAKKMNKTIAKKTNVTQLSIAGAPNLLGQIIHRGLGEIAGPVFFAQWRQS